MNKIGIIISLENYSESEVGLRGVKHADSDASEIRNIFENVFSIPKNKILEYRNEEATCTACGLSGDLNYRLKNLEPDTTIYFYYAGHGYFYQGDNYLTFYDTNRIDLERTVLSFEKVFLRTFKESNAKRLFAFIDACALDMNNCNQEIKQKSIIFQEERTTAIDYALFFSCSPGEKSFSSDSFHHGIWTHYLIEAFTNGMLNPLNVKGELTVNTLQAFLKDNVRKYVMNELNKEQTPYLIVASNDDIPLLSIDYEKSFEHRIKQLDSEFANRCYLVSLYIGLDNKFEFDNYDCYEKICNVISNRLPEKWTIAFTDLQQYINRIKEGLQINIQYQEQQNAINRINAFINSISTDERDYYKF